jgi:hypothetical protein
MRENLFFNREKFVVPREGMVNLVWFHDVIWSQNLPRVGDLALKSVISYLNWNKNKEKKEYLFYV